MNKKVGLILMCALILGGCSGGQTSGNQVQSQAESTSVETAAVESTDETVAAETESAAEETLAETKEETKSEADSGKLGNVMIRIPSEYKIVNTDYVKMESFGLVKKGQENAGTVLFMHDKTDLKVTSESDYANAADKFFEDLFGDASGIETGNIFLSENAYLSVYEADDSYIYLAAEYSTGELYSVAIPKTLKAEESINLYPAVGSILNGISGKEYDPGLDQYAYEWLMAVNDGFHDYNVASTSSENETTAEADHEKKNVEVEADVETPSDRKSKGTKPHITEVITSTTQDNPAPRGEWIEAKAYSAQDNEYHTIYFRVTNITNDGQDYVDEWNAGGHSMTFQKITDEALAYKTLHYEVYYPADFPQAEYGISSPQINFSITDYDGEGIIYDGSSYIGLSSVWDVTEWDSNDRIYAGEVFSGTAVFAMVDDASVQYEFKYSYQESSKDKTLFDQYANCW